MKKKRTIEADLDPPNTPRTRPGGQTAKRAHALAKGEPGGQSRKATTRPGATAARRVLADIRRRRDERK